MNTNKTERADLLSDYEKNREAARALDQANQALKPIDPNCPYKAAADRLNKQAQDIKRRDLIQTIWIVLTAAFLMFAMMYADNSHAEPLNLKVQAIASVGVYHRVDRYTHYKMLEQDYGSSTPATAKIGFRISECAHWACMGTENIDVTYSHQSYLDRGAPFNNKDETWIDMVGVEFTWKLGEWRL